MSHDIDIYIKDSESFDIKYDALLKAIVSVFPNLMYEKFPEQDNTFFKGNVLIYDSDFRNIQRDYDPEVGIHFDMCFHEVIPDEEEEIFCDFQLCILISTGSGRSLKSFFIQLMIPIFCFKIFDNIIVEDPQGFDKADQNTYTDINLYKLHSIKVIESIYSSEELTALGFENLSEKVNRIVMRILDIDILHLL